MQVSMHYNKFLSSLEHSVNDELQGDLKDKEIIDIKTNTTDNGFWATIIYKEKQG